MQVKMTLVDVTPQAGVGLNPAFAASYGWGRITGVALILLEL